MRDHWVTPFLEALRTTGVVAQACRAAGVLTSTAYQFKAKDADFAAEWDNALEDSYDLLETEARRRAIEGIEEPVVYQGQFTPLWERDERGELVMDEYDTGQVYPPAHDKAGQSIIGHRPRQVVLDGKPQFLTVRKKSDQLLTFLLKGYRKKFATDVSELTGAGGGPVQVTDATQRAARVQALLALAADRKQQDVSDLA